MMAAPATRHAVHCPTVGCGLKLGEVAGESAVFWRVCPDCGATIRYELPSRRWTVEQPAKRVPPSKKGRLESSYEREGAQTNCPATHRARG